MLFLSLYQGRAANKFGLLIGQIVAVDAPQLQWLSGTAIVVVFMLILGLAVAISVQIIGALLVLSVICTPAAAAMRVTSSPRVVPMLSMTFGLVSVVGGILLALGSSVPISPHVTTISFAIYLVCRVIGMRRVRRAPVAARLAEDSIGAPV
ncbi:hypothetical protein FGL98_13320 [Leekyejoonella antrihumi]|uniref:Metal ABC transporter permease n=1 Tax=Leekyejoonella antrihumi TaxID=1660198 RepID=A0A563DZ72_9MICO|nr:hypothetical protein FGL98_13320 [Leekyejoonella antrihumi]